MATFGIWQNEEMTIPFQNAAFSFIIGESQVRNGVFYFGSTDTTVKLQTEINSGVDLIELYPFFKLSLIQRNQAYEKTGCDDYVLNGYIYRLKVAGTTAATAPVFAQSIGSIITDGTAQWQCVSVAQKASDIKLALSEAGLDTAQAGAAVQLDNTIFGGTAIAVYYRLTNSVNNVFNSYNCPQLCIAINSCVESKNE